MPAPLRRAAGRVAGGQSVVPYDGNTPTASHATLLAALDAVAPDNPVVLLGADGHASAYNSQALASAEDQDGNQVGFNPGTLAPGGVFERFIPYVDLTSGVIRGPAAPSRCRTAGC